MTAFFIVAVYIIVSLSIIAAVVAAAVWLLIRLPALIIVHPRDLRRGESSSDLRGEFWTRWKGPTGPENV